MSKQSRKLLVSLDVKNLKQLEELCKKHGFKYEIVEDNPKLTLSEEFDSLKTIEDSPKVVASKKAVNACYNKVIAKPKVAFCREYKIISDNLSVLSKKEQQEFTTLQSKVATAKNEQEKKSACIARKAFSKKMLKKYKSLGDLFIDGCNNFRNNTTTK